MSLSKGAVTGGLVISGIVAGWFFVKRLRRMQVNLEAIPAAKLHKADLTGVTIRVDVILKNPTNGSLTIKFPFIKVIYNGYPVGSSDVVNKDIVIPQYGQVVIEEIMIRIPLLETLSVAYSLVKALINRINNGSKEPVKAGVTVITTAFVGSISKEINLPFTIPIL